MRVASSSEAARRGRPAAHAPFARRRTGTAGLREAAAGEAAVAEVPVQAAARPGLAVVTRGATALALSAARPRAHRASAREPAVASIARAARIAHGVATGHGTHAIRPARPSVLARRVCTARLTTAAAGDAGVASAHAVAGAQARVAHAGGALAALTDLAAHGAPCRCVDLHHRDVGAGRQRRVDRRTPAVDAAHPAVVARQERGAGQRAADHQGRERDRERQPHGSRVAPKRPCTRVGLSRCTRRRRRSDRRRPRPRRLRCVRRAPSRTSSRGTGASTSRGSRSR